MITASAAVEASYPGTFFGLMVIEGILNDPENPAFEEKKAALEEELRRRHRGKTRKDISRRTLSRPTKGTSGSSARATRCSTRWRQ